MAKVHVEEITLEESDVLDIHLPSGHTVSVYANGEVVTESKESPWTEYSVNVVTKVERAAKKERKERKALV